jgi:hypothetical protein
MRLHLGSFLMGCAVAAGGMALGPRLRPILVDLAAVAYRSIDRLGARLSVAREDLEDTLAEARARARGDGSVGVVEPS